MRRASAYGRVYIIWMQQTENRPRKDKDSRRRTAHRVMIVLPKYDRCDIVEQAMMHN